jgi:lactoylglutathione lyase
MNHSFDTLLDQFEQKQISRRQLLPLLVAAAGAASLAPTALAQSVSRAAKGRSLNHISLSVADVSKSAAFYQQLLGMEIISRPANGGLNMGLGNESFLGLYAFSDPGRMHHMCIGVDNFNADELAKKLAAHNITARVNRDPANRTSGGDQIYFNDPDGISVQLAQHGYLG